MKASRVNAGHENCCSSHETLVRPCTIIKQLLNIQSNKFKLFD